jgi:hypothetical protein
LNHLPNGLIEWHLPRHTPASTPWSNMDRPCQPSHNGRYIPPQLQPGAASRTRYTATHREELSPLNATIHQSARTPTTAPGQPRARSPILGRLYLYL